MAPGTSIGTLSRLGSGPRKYSSRGIYINSDSDSDDDHPRVRTTTTIPCSPHITQPTQVLTVPGLGPPTNLIPSVRTANPDLTQPTHILARPGLSSQPTREALANIAALFSSDPATSDAEETTSSHFRAKPAVATTTSTAAARAGTVTAATTSTTAATAATTPREAARPRNCTFRSRIAPAGTSFRPPRTMQGPAQDPIEVSSDSDSAGQPADIHRTTFSRTHFSKTLEAYKYTAGPDQPAQPDRAGASQVKPKPDAFGHIMKRGNSGTSGGSNSSTAKPSSGAGAGDKTKPKAGKKLDKKLDNKSAKLGKTSAKQSAKQTGNVDDPEPAPPRRRRLVQGRRPDRDDDSASSSGTSGRGTRSRRDAGTRKRSPSVTPPRESEERPVKTRRLQRGLPPRSSPVSSQYPNHGGSAIINLDTSSSSPDPINAATAATAKPIIISGDEDEADDTDDDTDDDGNDAADAADNDDEHDTYKNPSYKNQSSSDDEHQSDDDTEGTLLKCLNNSPLDDLAAIAKRDKADVYLFIGKRPFSSLKDARRVVNKHMDGSRKASRVQLGDTIVDAVLEFIEATTAIEHVIADCEAKARIVKREIDTWDMGMFGEGRSQHPVTPPSHNDTKNGSADDNTKKSASAKNTSAKNGSANDTSANDANSHINNKDSAKDTSANKDSVKDTSATNTSANNHTNKNASAGFVSPPIPEQPALMDPSCQMKPFQLFGLNWMQLCYKNKFGCILADEMGLGKTCQVISFACHLAEIGKAMQQDEAGAGARLPWPNLIVVPPSTYANWLAEFAKFAPGLAVIGYQGTQAQRVAIADDILEDRHAHHVVLTTYSQLNSDADSDFVRELRPNMAVFDEGHKMKNPNTKVYRDLMRIPARWRMLLTGTPVQNNLLEMISLLRFINPTMFGGVVLEHITSVFSSKVSVRDITNSAFLYRERIRRARTILEPFILQRRKHQVVADMPAKRRTVVHCDLTASQRPIYDEYATAFAADRATRRPAKQPTGRGNDQNNVWMQLRKAALHPLLFRRFFDNAKVDRIATLLMKHVPQEDLQQPNLHHLVTELGNASDFELHLWCRDYPHLLAEYDVDEAALMDSGKVAKLLELVDGYRQTGDRVLVFSRWARVIEILDEVLFSRGVALCKLSGETSVADRQEIINKFNGDPEIPVFLLTTAAGGTGINLTAANKVIIFDQSDNPQDDIQAENRAHRLGQTREVEVIRLIGRDTVEELIFQACEKKIELANRVTGADDDDGAAVSAAAVARNLEAEVKAMMTQQLTPP